MLQVPIVTSLLLLFESLFTSGIVAVEGLGRAGFLEHPSAHHSHTHAHSHSCTISHHATIPHASISSIHGHAHTAHSPSATISHGAHAAISHHASVTSAHHSSISAISHAHVGRPGEGSGYKTGDEEGEADGGGHCWLLVVQSECMMSCERCI